MRKQRSFTIADGNIIQERLPMPIVHYPKRYGAFIGFSETESGRVFMCSCYRTAIENYFIIRWRKFPRYYQQERNIILSDSFFPEPLPTNSVILLKAKDTRDLIIYEDGLCHRCNHKEPSLYYCDPMYGVKFEQRYGWYIKQNFFRYGVYPYNYVYEETLCPTEIKGALRDMFKLQNHPADQGAPNTLLFNDEEVPLFDRRFAQSKKIIDDRIQDLTRIEFGFKKIGEKWDNETKLYKTLQSLFPDLEIHYHYRPEWLEGMELDVFLPALGIAIEYFGEQHYRYFDHWGGERAFVKLKQRDKLKKVLCKKKNVRLIVLTYKYKLSRETIAHLMSRYLKG